MDMTDKTEGSVSKISTNGTYSTSVQSQSFWSICTLFIIVLFIIAQIIWIIVLTALIVDLRHRVNTLESDVNAINAYDNNSTAGSGSSSGSGGSGSVTIIVNNSSYTVIYTNETIRNDTFYINNVNNYNYTAYDTYNYLLNNYTSLGSVTLPLSTAYSVSTNELPVAVSLHPIDNKIINGAGTSIYLNSQTHYYSPAFTTPNHLWITHIINDTVLMSFGTEIALAWPTPNNDWVSGNQGNFNSPTDVPTGYGPFSTLPYYADNIVFLSLASPTTAILVAVSGPGAIALSVNLTTGVITQGPLTKFVTGASIDTDTATIDSSTFAISFYAGTSTTTLNTILGSVSFPNITFSASVDYSQNHEFHQIVGLGPGLYGLAFPYDMIGTSNSVSSPMAVMVAAVKGTSVATKSITIFSSDGAGTPWINTNFLGYYFFDMLLLDREELSIGVTCTVALSVVDRTASDSIIIFLFTVTATGSVGSFNSIDVRFGNQLTATSAGATIAYNYYSMSPLFDLSAQLLTTTQPSLPGTRDMMIAWQDTAKSGAVEAIVISYDVTTTLLSLIVPTTPITVPFSSSLGGSHWWVGGGALSAGKVLVLTTIGQNGSISIVEHLSTVIGITDNNQTSSNFSTIDIVVDGYVLINTSDLLPSSSTLPSNLSTVWSTSRGELMSDMNSILTIESTGNTVTVSVGIDSCIGVVGKRGDGVWVDTDICKKFSSAQ